MGGNLKIIPYCGVDANGLKGEGDHEEMCRQAFVRCKQMEYLFRWTSRYWVAGLMAARGGHGALNGHLGARRTLGRVAQNAPTLLLHLAVVCVVAILPKAHPTPAHPITKWASGGSNGTIGHVSVHVPRMSSHFRMTTDSTTQPFAALAQRLHPQNRLVRAWPLKGGVSATVTALELMRPDGHHQKVIVRQHGVRDRQRNPQIATAEFSLLQVLQQAGVAAPAPYYLDQAGEFFGIPCLVMAYVEGETRFAPTDLTAYLAQLATHLAHIHGIAGTQTALPFLPRQAQGFGERPANLDHTLDEGRIRDKLEALWPIAQTNRAMLLHGDFWPGNLLWRDEQLVAVIDWEDAAVGDPLADLGNTRLELLWAFGEDAMTQFTALYQSLTTITFTDLPYWDLCAALRPSGKLGEWGLDAVTEQTMRERHHWFVTQAFAQLAEQGR